MSEEVIIKPVEETAQVTTEEKPPQKRGRGRPKKDPTLPGATSVENENRPGRRAKAPKGIDAASLAKQIVGVHHIVAAMTGIHELVIGDAEGEALAKGIAAVADEYGLSFSGKTGAAIQLLTAAAMVYGPRALAVAARVKQAKMQQIAGSE